VPSAPNPTTVQETFVSRTIDSTEAAGLVFAVEIHDMLTAYVGLPA
jgi:hypothetical protein